MPVLGTWRLDDPATPALTTEWWQRVQRLPTCATLVLQPLGLEETVEQVALLVPGAADPALVERIHRRSQGQPLFTEQLVGLDEADDLPRLLADLLDRRLSGLGASAWAIASALGVADRSLPDPLLRIVTGLDPADLTTGLHELVDRRLLRPVAGREVELGHPLLAEAIRRRLLAFEVTDEHRRLALALSNTVDPSAAEVAEHWRRAEDPAEEVVWRIRAAQAAGERFAPVQAAEQWRRALALWPDDEDSLGTPPMRKHDAYLAAMDALVFTDVDAAWEVAQRAMSDIAAAADIDDAATYRRAGSIRGWLDDPEGGLELVERALAIHRSTRPSVEYLRALNEHDTLLQALGRYDEAHTSTARALELSAGLDAPEVHRNLLIQQAFDDLVTGDVECALERLDEAASVELPGPDPEGGVRVGIARTEILIEAGHAGDEIFEAGRPGLEAAGAWGLDTARALMLRANMSCGFRLSGQVARAAALIDPVVLHLEPTLEDMPIHHERASIDMLQGRCAEAVAAFDSMAVMPMPLISNRIQAAEHAASAYLWCGRPHAALDRLVGVLGDSAATAASAETGALLSLAARAAADVAGASNASDSARRELRDQVQRLLEQAKVDPFTRAGGFEARPAHRAAWAAETARLVGRSSVELWSEAAGHWDRPSRPHDAAYCRWRGAEAALASGQGTTASRLLRRAAREAREHVPLSTAIASTAERARLAPRG